MLNTTFFSILEKIDIARKQAYSEFIHLEKMYGSIAEPCFITVFAGLSGIEKIISKSASFSNLIPSNMLTLSELLSEAYNLASTGYEDVECQEELDNTKIAAPVEYNVDIQQCKAIFLCIEELFESVIWAHTIIKTLPKAEY